MGIHGKFLGAAALLGAGCLTGQAQAASLNTPDSDALIAGYQIIQFDLQECRALAPQGGLSRYVSSTVLDLSAKICADAAHYRPLLQKAAEAHHFALPDTLPFYLTARYEAMIRHPDETLGTRYLQDQIASHRDALAVFEEEAAAGKSPEIKAMAIQVIPVVKGNLDALQSQLSKE